MRRTMDGSVISLVGGRDACGRDRGHAPVRSGRDAAGRAATVRALLRGRQGLARDCSRKGCARPRFRRSSRPPGAPRQRRPRRDVLVRAERRAGRLVGNGFGANVRRRADDNHVLSPPEKLGPTFSGITGDQEPTRWRADGSPRSSREARTREAWRGWCATGGSGVRSADCEIPFRRAGRALSVR